MPARTLVTLGRIPYGVAAAVATGDPLGSLIVDDELSAALLNGANGVRGRVNGNGDMGGFTNGDDEARGFTGDE